MQPARAYDAEDPLGPGTVVAGQYRVDGLITLGGTSFVYRATDLRLARPVALKVLQRALGRHAPRFEREALATAALTHPSVVRLFDFGLLADRRPYLVFELVAGEPLSACLAREGALPPDEAARRSKLLPWHARSGLDLANVVAVGLFTAMQRAGVPFPDNDGTYDP